MGIGQWFVLLNICAYSSGISVWWLEGKRLTQKAWA